MNALAHYLAARHGCPSCGDSIAVLLTAMHLPHAIAANRNIL